MSASPIEPRDFADELASTSPTPGGGAAAARAGLFAAALLRKVAAISGARLASRVPEHDDDAVAIRGIEEDARALGARFRELEAQDIAAFAGYIAARRLPRSSPEEVEARRRAIGDSLLRATDAPQAIIDAAVEALGLADRLVKLAARSVLRAESDVGCAIDLARAAARAAELNVRVNLPHLEGDKSARVERLTRSLSRLEAEYDRLRREVLRCIDPDAAR